jgi:hypothetical protein
LVGLLILDEGENCPVSWTHFSAKPIRSFARSWVTELKGRGIWINALSPGPIEMRGEGAPGDEEVALAYKTTV